MLIVVIGVVLSGRWVMADEPVVDRVTDRVGTVDGVVEGEVVEVSVDGVRVEIDGEGVGKRSVVVPWFEIREVADGWVVPSEFEEISRLAMLGYGRRVRGDLAGCGLLYGRLAEELAGSESEMAREVFGGLLEEAMVRGDLFDAAVAMAALGIESVDGIDGFDSRFGVYEGVPLVRGIGGGHRLESVGELLVARGGDGALVVRAFGVVNEVHGFEGEDVVELISELDGPRDASLGYRRGLELYSKMLAAQRHLNAEEREDARRWLKTRSESKAESWIDAWARLALGASFIGESVRSDEGVSRGVVELVHVMVRFGEDRPMLGRVAVQLAVDGLRDVGRFDEAGELMQGFDATMIGMD